MWMEAEADAQAVLAAARVTAVHKRKALWRLYLARKGRMQADAANEALEQWVAAGGSSAEAAKEKGELQGMERHDDVDEVASTLQNTHLDKDDPSFVHPDTAQDMFTIKDDVHGGKGAFAQKALERGILILAEKPLLRPPAGYKEEGPVSPQTVLTLVERLSPTDVARLVSLRNARADDARYPHHCFAGIWSTNAFSGAGICLVASRFIHSCVPNARYSWHAESQRQRIFALRSIAPGEEICVSYLMGRNIYGSSSATRCAWLSDDYRFECACAVCGGTPEEVAASDHRRSMLARIWRALPTMQDDPRLAVREIASAIRIMREEGFHMDADDFAGEAVNCCAVFSDWESAKYWATLMYESRKAEFGEDSGHTRKAKAIMENPGDRRRLPMAGRYSGVKFTDIRV
ncbi:hypothetical protein BD626DRAFT_275854 [Schizophyllum amplum]|uniref:SET domain-containing protein n=1 Tax=Schizophyllum amplum TaxID=97359 RepID=A0A550CFY8_9AGAR|nr:hypothetical protein BD626DRAFT_275854 [Auriculariopsis ampla]